MRAIGYQKINVDNDRVNKGRNVIYIKTPLKEGTTADEQLLGDTLDKLALSNMPSLIK